jgi:hypothetical protein
VTSCRLHVQQISVKRYRICGGDLTRSSCPDNHYTKKGHVKEPPPSGLSGPPRHTSLAKHTAFAKGVMSVLCECSTDERPNGSHICRFTPRVVCEVRPDFAHTHTHTRTIQESFVFRRLGPVFHRGGPSSIRGAGGTILRGVNPK